MRRRSTSTAARSSSSTSTSATCASEPVLADFSLRVAPGETVALVGTSGSGKSTVSLLLPRFYDVQYGLDHASTASTSPTSTLDSLRREVGVVFEDAFLFSDSVRNNIAYGRPDATDADVERAARGRGCARVHRGAPRRLRHRRRRARAHAVRWPAPAHRHRPCRAHRPARARARRRHVVDRRPHRGADPRDAARDHGAPHHDPHRAPALHPAPRRPHHRDGATATRSRTAPTTSSWPRSARYRALLVRARRRRRGRRDRRARRAPAAVTADLWRPRRDERSGAARAFVSVAPVLGHRRPGGAWAWVPARGVGMGDAARRRARRSPPSSSPRSTRCRRPTTSPTSTSPPRRPSSETFRLRRFLRPYRSRLLIGFGLIVVDTILMLAGPLLVQQRPATSGVLEGSETGAVHRVGALLPHRHSPTGCSRGRTRATRAAPRSGCSTRCASGSSRTCSGSRSTSTTARWRVGS